MAAFRVRGKQKKGKGIKGDVFACGTSSIPAITNRRHWGVSTCFRRRTEGRREGKEKKKKEKKGPASLHSCSIHSHLSYTFIPTLVGVEGWEEGGENEERKKGKRLVT